MNKLQRSDLWSLEQYAQQRDEFRNLVIAHKQHRRVALDPHVTLLFEDFLTMKYQVQEMLRAERVFEAAGIQEEIDAYNPLIPDGSNWKATMLIEYDDAQERRQMLGKLGGVEHRVFVEVADNKRRFGIANEDMERSTDEKAAAVHFLRFELTRKAISALRAGATVSVGIDDARLPCRVDLTAAARASLLADLD